MGNTGKAVDSAALGGESALDLLSWVGAGHWSLDGDASVRLDMLEEAKGGEDVDYGLRTLEGETLPGIGGVLVLSLDASDGLDSLHDVLEDGIVVELSDPSSLDSVGSLDSVDSRDSESCGQKRQEKAEDRRHGWERRLEMLRLLIRVLMI